MIRRGSEGKEDVALLTAPSGDASIAKKVLIPAAVAGAIGVAGLGGFQHTGERICTRSEMCQPEKIRLPDRHDPEPSIPLHGQVTTLTPSSTAANLPSALTPGFTISK